MAVDLERNTQRRLCRLLGGSLLVYFFLGVVIFGKPWQFVLERRIAEIKARGEPVSLDDLSPQIPVEENGTPLIEAICQSMKNSFHSDFSIALKIVLLKNPRFQEW